ncbi:hypothetical protein PPL_07342 [Heterostelium album PN500]|uniref:Uncharacterized protein n=1 Tax=Heterostelium pallidum (strain ATCC 26659 / Pp 5 / PN500) TaxID=670386 RepID=D3BF25_HETP5|nr:hypothetical protein PPL_07342 [Heterostelium album PN500]EFA80506.1 hypothetical protein PPL_07342 [Heterostelium album PN500]|eukprot:XP_020432626.1 hypothetical protein PPL_07342 [Heterostelium album PN500]
MATTNSTPTVNQIIYEVTAVVNKEIAEKWDTYIQKHVSEIVSLENGTLFKKGVIHKLTQPSDPATEEYVMQYFVVSQETLDTYVKVHAPRLREEALTLFSTGGLKTSRRIYAVLHEIQSIPQTKEFGYVF